MPQTIPEEALRLHHIFGDETCQDSHRWMVLGTLIVSEAHVAHVRRKFLAMKKAMGLAEEVKWHRTNAKLLPRYKRLVDAAFALILKHKVMQFHSMLICMDVVDHEKYNDGIPEIGYSRFFHHLLLKYIRTYPPTCKYHVHFDKRTSKVPLEPFRDAANIAARRDHNIDHWPIRRLRYVDSKDDILFEINDLLVGAIGFRRNGKHKVAPTKGGAKDELARYIMRASPVHSFWADTAAHNLDFSLWALRFGGQRGADAFRNRSKSKAARRLRQQRAARARSAAARV